jgi:hypothetical protein
LNTANKFLDSMELIEIISTVLLFGGGLLVFVVCLSFFISRFKNESVANKNKRYTHTGDNQRFSQPKIRFTQPKKTTSFITPQIFQLEQVRPREIKMIRKMTFQETINNAKERSTDSYRNNGNNNRYKIINEEQRKTTDKVVNLY